VPFDNVRLHQLYPTFRDYWVKMRRATDRSVVEGWVLSADASDLMSRTCRAKFRWPAAKPGPCYYTPPRWDSA
jgi:hypothetical protein